MIQCEKRREEKRRRYDDPPPTNVVEDGHGLLFEYINIDEAELLYDEIVVRRSYGQHGIEVRRFLTLFLPSDQHFGLRPR